MEKAEITRILSAPISLLRHSSEKEKELFSDKTGGYFFTFGLASGQRFVGYIPEMQESYLFRPLKNLLPNLQEIQWERETITDISDLGYVTTCRTLSGTSDEEKQAYMDVLVPKPEDPSHFPFTRIAFKYYSYHPMLGRARDLQMAELEHEKAKQALIKSQKRIDSLLISGKSKNLIQQKFNKRRQNG